jgi:hypothetical protein
MDITVLKGFLKIDVKYSSMLFLPQNDSLIILIRRTDHVKHYYMRNGCA